MRRKILILNFAKNAKFRIGRPDRERIPQSTGRIPCGAGQERLRVWGPSTPFGIRLTALRMTLWWCANLELRLGSGRVLSQNEVLGSVAAVAKALRFQIV